MNSITVDNSCWKLKFGESLLVVGSTNVGKSVFVERLLATPQLWEGKADNIMYCYAIENETAKRLSEKNSNIILHKGVPENLGNPRQLFPQGGNSILIFDDLQTQLESSRDYTQLLSVGNHHCGIFTICIGHSLFAESKERRLQCPHYSQICLMQNRRCFHQIANLARQLGQNPALVQAAYKDACSQRFGYLILDVRNETPPELSVITNVFCEKNSPCYVYI